MKRTTERTDVTMGHITNILAQIVLLFLLSLCMQSSLLACAPWCSYSLETGIEGGEITSPANDVILGLGDLVDCSMTTGYDMDCLTYYNGDGTIYARGYPNDTVTYTWSGGDTSINGFVGRSFTWIPVIPGEYTLTCTTDDVADLGDCIGNRDDAAIVSNSVNVTVVGVSSIIGPATLSRDVLGQFTTTIEPSGYESMIHWSAPGASTNQEAQGTASFSTQWNTDGVKTVEVYILDSAGRRLSVKSHQVIVGSGVIHVKTDGNDLNNGLSWSNAVATISRAIEIASSGQEIWVEEGTYSGGDPVILKAGIGLYGGFAGSETSRNQRDWLLHLTVIDRASGVNVPSGSNNTVIDGFTIRNSVSVGIYCVNSSVTISHNIITNNAGSGIECYNSPNALISNNLIKHTGYYAGIYCYLSPISVVNNTVVGDEYDNGYFGICVGDCNATLSNNIVAFNSYGIARIELDLWDFNPILNNNCVYGNTNNYNGFSPGFVKGPTDIISDPCFVNTSTGDFHLQNNSPCIDSGKGDAVGISLVDLDGKTRIIDFPNVGNSFIDLGAYECQAIAKPIFTPIGGKFSDGVNVTIKCATSGVTIRYTLDGSDPDEMSLIYHPSGAIFISRPDGVSVTLKARAYKTNCEPSPIVSTIYRFSSPSSTVPYTCRRYVKIAAPAIVDFRVTDIYRDSASNTHGAMSFRWTNEWNKTSNIPVHEYNVWRNSESLPCDSGDSSLTDSLNIIHNNPITYSIQMKGWTDPSHLLDLPLCLAVHSNYPYYPYHHPGCLNTYINYYWEDSTTSTPFVIIPIQVNASENQAVDSRLDARYDPNEQKFVDFQFGDSVFRGGLFVGLADDPSRVGRSFVKFPVQSAIPAGKSLHAGSVNMYHTQSFNNSTNTDIGCHFINDDSWCGGTIVWSTAPTLNSSQPNETVVVGPLGVQSGLWCHFSKMFDYIVSETYGDDILSIGLASVNDIGGWAYFAKKEYDASLTPHLLLACGDASISPIEVILDSNTVYPGSTVSGTARLNAPAPVGGMPVQIKCTHPNYADVPDVITIPGGAMSGSFEIHTETNTPANTIVSIVAGDTNSVYYSSVDLKITVN